MWKDTDCSFKGIWSTSFSIAKGLFNTKGVIRNRGSYKQDHTEAQTWPRDGKSSDENIPGQTHQLVRICGVWKCLFFSVRLSD